MKVKDTEVNSLTEELEALRNQLKTTTEVNRGFVIVAVHGRVRDL